MNDVQEKRLTFLKAQIDEMIGNGRENACYHNVSVSDYDVDLAQDYARSLNLHLSKTTCSGAHGDPTYNHAPKPIFEIRMLEKEEIVDENDKIYVTSNDYERLNFCRRNWICKAVFNIFGRHK